MSNWRKSSFSSGSSGNCVEAASMTGAVQVRDTTDRDGVILAVSGDAWAQFTASIRN